MAFTKKVWKSHISEYPNRRTITPAGTGTSGTMYFVQRAEGVVSQEGDAFSKANMNNLEDRIEAGFNDEHIFLTGTLAANTTILEITNASIDADAIIRVFVPLEKSNLVYESLSIVNEHTLRMVFPRQSTDTVIKVKVEHDTSVSS